VNKSASIVKLLFLPGKISLIIFKHEKAEIKWKLIISIIITD